MVDYENGGGMV